MSVMTKEKFVQQFTHDWFNHLSFGHLYRYHLDIPEENLRERVQSGSAFAASTFLDDWDQPVSDWILEKILQMDVPIRRWLDDDTQHGPFVLIRHIPQRYGTILVDVGGKTSHPGECFIALKKTCGKVDFVTAYPVELSPRIK